MDWLANLLEIVIQPLLLLLDRSGLFQTLRFSPIYRLIAALSAIVLSAYVISLLTRPIDRGFKATQRFRVVGRLFAVILAAIITREIFSDTAFVLERAGPASAVLRSNLGFLLVLGLIVFLEIRLIKKH